MRIYLDQIELLAFSNKYTKLYLTLCRRGLSRASTRKVANNILGYSEKHHILPKCFGLGGVNDSLNFVYLSAREHFIVHRLLTKMFSGVFHQKMCWAVKNLTRSKYISKLHNITSKVYLKIKLDANLATSVALKGRKHKPLSPEAAFSKSQKLSAARIGKKLSQDTRKKMQKPKTVEARKNMCNRKVKDSTREKLSNSHKGKVVGMETRRKQSVSATTRPPICESTRRKLSVIHKGKCKSEDHKRALSNMQKNQPLVSCLSCRNTYNKRIFTRFHKTKCLCHKI